MSDGTELIPEVNITHLMGNIMQVVEEPAMFSVLWGELFHINEREFLRKHMKKETVYFSLRDTYQINVRMVLRPEAKHGINPHMDIKIAYLLHDYDGRLTTSWTWAKFAKQLYKQGISVIMPDFPGLGTSTVNQLPHVPLETWRTQDWHIVLQITDHFKLPKVNCVSVGKACAGVVRMIQKSPLALASEHIFFNPILDRDELFKMVDVSTLEFNQSAHEVRLQEHEREFSSTLRNYGFRIWAVFDERHALETQDSYELLSRATRHTMCRTNKEGIPEICRLVTVTRLSKEDITDCQIGVKLKLNFLHPSKRVRAAFAQYLAHTGEGADVSKFMSTALIQRKIAHIEETEIRKGEAALVLAPVRKETRRISNGGTIYEGKPMTPAQEFVAMSACTGKWPAAVWPEEREGHAKALGLRVPTASDTGSEAEDQDVRGNSKRRTATRMADCLIQSKAALGRDATSSRIALLETRKHTVAPPPPQKVDADLLAEEAAIHREVIEESKKTASYEREKHKAQQLALKKFVQEAQGAGLSKGVIRYMRKAATIQKSDSAPQLR